MIVRHMNKLLKRHSRESVDPGPLAPERVALDPDSRLRGVRDDGLGVYHG
jgi:hypothetical protein